MKLTKRLLRIRRPLPRECEYYLLCPVITSFDLARASKSRKGKEDKEEEEALDRDISQLLEPLAPAPSTPSSLSSLEDDSILEPDSEAEEEEEVSGLLVEA